MDKNIFRRRTHEAQQMRWRLRSRRAMTITFAVTISWCTAAVAGGSLTLAQLARNEGWHPDHESVPGYLDLDKDIPRDFPVPDSAHELSASNAVAAAGVKGVTAAQATTFYREAFARLNWSIRREMHLPGYAVFVACPQTGRCVNLSVADPGGAVSPAGMKMTFFDRDAKP
ncbi:hypothetical protein [Solimonas marina]|uniref:Uncharacterized protein n=1 Tax=Solimonas marina TaxID=2714601 RepID=A0A969W5W4_9GAMM|nr:hypothetical protein [Solimonas marina]NKF21012.1 hypothetical protein [Solimonas marina]